MSKTRPNRRRRRVAVVTGTRAEYGLLRSTLQAISEQRRLNLQLVVTGMHLLPKFGRTIDMICRDGWPIAAKIRMQTGKDDPADQAAGLSRGVAGVARFLIQARSDIVLVLGDRIEAMAGALAGVTTGRIVAHIHGGDIAPGDIDGCLRDSITKLAHLHFAATPAARRRLIDMGEAVKRVYVVGAAGLDDLLQLLQHRASPSGSTGRSLIVYHPCGRPEAIERRTMARLLRVVEGSGLQRTIIYPNSDRGHSGVVKAIEEHRRGSTNGGVHVFRSVPRDQYLRLLIDSDVLVGNSSSGIIEAAAAGTPVVNIGDRQHGRERNKRWVIDVGESADSISDGLRRALNKSPRRSARTAYGDGRAGRRIARILASVSLTETLRRKSENLSCAT